MRKLITSFWMLAIIIGITNSITAQDPSATLSSDSNLYESNLDRRILTIDLTSENFVSYIEIQKTDFILLFGPVGLTIDSVVGTSSTQANIYLAYDQTDYDIAIVDFRVQINKDILVQTTETDLVTNTLYISSYVEQPAAYMTDDSGLFEFRLDYSILSIDLYEEQFANYTGLQISDFDLVNEPPGLTIQSVIGISPTKVNIDLQFDGTDFDKNITDFHVTISSSTLIQTTSGLLPTNPLTIQCNSEEPTAILTSDEYLSEYTLDDRILIIDLVDEMFLDSSSLSTSDFTLINQPPGLSIEKVNGISSTKVEIYLAYDGRDLDIHYMDFHVGISSSVLQQTSSGVLHTNNIWHGAYLENPSATLTPDSILTEQNLDSRTLTIELFEEMFVDYDSLSISNFALVNAPAGLTIESVQGISPTQAKITLAFNGTDFDNNILDFRLNISSSILIQSQIGYLTTSPLIIHSSVEIPIASLTADSILTEQRLDARSLTINLTDEQFIDYTYLKASDFAFRNAPTGLSVDSVYGVSHTEVTIDLAFDGTDFDDSITDFFVTISSSILIETVSGYLATNQLTIHINSEEPTAIISPSAPLGEYTLDQRILTIELKNEMFIDSSSLTPSDFDLINSPAGLSIDSIKGISDTKVEIYLAFDGTDFDDTYTSFHVGISASVLVQTSWGVLYTNNLIIFGHPEVPEAELTADSILTEHRLDARTLSINLIEEEFIDYTMLLVSDFTLINAPTGLSIESILAIDSVNVDLNLQFTGEDFINDISDFSVTIKREVLIQSTATNLLTNPLTIIADVKVIYDTVVFSVYDTIFETITDTNTVTFYDTIYKTVIDTNLVYIYDTITETLYDTITVTIEDTLNVIRFTELDCEVTLTDPLQGLSLEVRNNGDYLSTNVMFDDCYVYDLTGSLIKIINLNTEIPVNDLESGIYLFRFIIGGVEIVQRFYIE